MVLFKSDGADPKSVDQDIDGSIDHRGDKERPHIERRGDLPPVGMKPVQGQLDTVDRFVPQQHIADEILSVEEGRIGDGVAQPYDGDGDGDVEFGKRSGRHHPSHLHRHRDRSPKPSDRNPACHAATVGTKIASWEVVFFEQRIDFRGGFPFGAFECFAYHPFSVEHLMNRV